MISLRVIFKEIGSQKLRLILAIFSVAWGTASISFMLSIGQGLRESFVKKASGGGDVTLAIQPFYTTKSYHGVPKNSKVRFTEKSLMMFASIPGVKEITNTKTFVAKTRRGKRTSYASPVAVTPNYASIESIDAAKGGRFINYLDIKKGKKVAFIGDQVAKWLFPKIEDPVGATINVGGELFEVVGISSSSMGFSNYGSSVSNQVLIPLSTYRQLSGDFDVTQSIFLLDKNANIEKIKENVLDIVASEEGFSPKDKGAINFSDSASTAKVMNTFLFGFEVFLGIIGGMTLLVSGVGIANIMYMSIKRATRIIGTQMAIGATYGSILIHYFIEAIIITLFGGIVGLLSTWGVVELIDIIPIQSKVYAQLGSPRPILSWGVLVTVIVVLGLIGFLAAFFPAKNAALTEPALALREEG